MGQIKNIFITGGSAGIGRAIVERFAKDKNYFCYFTFNSNAASANEIMQSHSNTCAFKCNISKEDDVVSVCNLLSEKKTAIDILVNCAGIMKDSTFYKMPRSIWEEVIDTNLYSLYSFTQPFLNQMQEKKWGRIINFSSVAGIAGAFGKTNYSASKAGVIGFTKALALETAKKGITVNAIAPGMIDTDMIKSIPQQYLENILGSIPAARFGKPEEVADLVYFLAGESAAYITGQVIGINGGMYM